LGIVETQQEIAEIQLEISVFLKENGRFHLEFSDSKSPLISD
jgi:hypothetical protein